LCVVCCVSPLVIADAKTAASRRLKPYGKFVNWLLSLILNLGPNFGSGFQNLSLRTLVSALGNIAVFSLVVGRS